MPHARPRQVGGKLLALDKRVRETTSDGKGMGVRNSNCLFVVTNPTSSRRHSG